MNISEIIHVVSSNVMGTAFVTLCLLVGIYFSIRTKFLQVRYLKTMVTLLFNSKPSKDGISSFQSFMLALSGRVGTGNIAGVATAIALGGPGAVFWMWTLAFLGASTAYVEAALGQIYKEKIGGTYRGGPAYYIRNGLGIKWFAMLFAVAAILANGLFLPWVQSSAISDAFYNAFGIHKMMIGISVALLLAVIIFGGIRRIAKFAEIVTPFMAAAYIILALIIIVINIDHVPAMFALILKSALGLEPAFAGIVGAAISMGVKRGIFSNEAGQGSAPHAAAAAEVSHPAKQGLVQAFSVYVDTLLVCSATAFMILITGCYKVFGADGSIITSGGGLSADVTTYGPIYTQQAVETCVPGMGSIFVAMALFFFAFTTLISYYFQAETNMLFIFREKRSSALFINMLRVIMLVMVLYSSVNTMTLAWDLADIGVGIMAWSNIVAIILLQRPALLSIKDYDRQLRAGIKEPVFDVVKLKIKNADIWNTINKK